MIMADQTARRRLVRANQHKAWFVLVISQILPTSLASLACVYLMYLLFAPTARSLPPVIQIITVAASFAISLARFWIVSRLDFRVLYWLKRVGNFVAVYSVATLLLLVLLASLPGKLTSQFVSVIPFPQSFLGLLLAASLGVLMGLYGNPFKPGKLPSLCFRQAIQLNGLSKHKWITRGLSELRDYLREFDIDFDHSTFMRLFAIKIADAQTVDDDLRMLSGSNPLTSLRTLLNREDMGFISACRGWRDRLSLDLVLKVVKLLSYATGVIIAILAAIGWIHIPVGLPQTP